MFTLLDLSFLNTKEVIVDLVVIFVLFIGMYSGYRNGFLKSSVKFVGFFAVLIISYLFKNPISIYLYTKLPFFKLDGIFKGVSVFNIIIYELIAFVFLFSVLFILLNVLCKISGLIDKVISWLFSFRNLSKFLGSIVGILQSLVFLFFGCYIFKFVCSYNNVYYEKNLSDYIVKMPLLSDVFSDAFDAVDEILSIARDYDSVNDKDEYNYMALDILLKYEVISLENAKELIEQGKIKIVDSDKLIERYE